MPNSSDKESEYKNQTSPKTITIEYILYLIAAIIIIFTLFADIFSDINRLLSFWIAFFSCLLIIITGYVHIYHIKIKKKVTRKKLIIYLLIFSIILISVSFFFLYNLYPKQLMFLSKIKHLITLFFNSSIWKLKINIWILIFPLILILAIYKYRQYLSIFIKEHILYHFIPYISFFSMNLGKKLIKFCCNQDNIHSMSYLIRLKNLKKCFFHSALYFLIIPVSIFVTFLSIFGFDKTIKYPLLFLGVFIAGSNFLSSKRKHKYHLTSPSEDDISAENNVSIFLYLLASALILIDFIRFIKSLTMH